MPGAESFVIDTSVAIKWIVDEDGSDAALALGGADMIAPALLRTEAGNVLRTMYARKDVSAEQALDLFAFLQTAPVVIVDHDEDLERRALELALALRNPIYDCVYLALAERTGRRLVTADRRFLRSLTGTEHAGSALDLYELDRAAPL